VGAGAVFTLGVLAALAVRSADRDIAPPPVERSAATRVRFLMEQQWLVRMKLARAELTRVALPLNSTGRIIAAPTHHATVASAVGGILTGTLPLVGESVTKDQVVARVAQTPTSAEALQMAVARATLEWESVRIEAERRRLTQLGNEARARMLLAIVEAEHAKRLFDHKAYSLNQYQQAQHDLKKAETDYDAAMQQLDALSRIELPSFDQGPVSAVHDVVSPLAGGIVKVLKSVGERVGAGEPIVEIVNLAKVWVETPIFERDLARLTEPVRARVATPAYGERVFHASLVDVGAVIDESRRAATVLFELRNPDRALKVGMQATVELETGETREAALLPREAVVEIDGRPHVYVLLSGEEFERRPVELADVIGDRVVVVEGLVAGERVATRGAFQIRLEEQKPTLPGQHTH
jgi:cobalt-zinc-cadmium efflux system membrane fusion protein